MFSPNDEVILEKRGITTKQIEEQLHSFVTGFPYLEIKSAAEIGNGIVQVSEGEINNFLTEWENYLQSEATIQKFVPASGAASRMFKDLFEFLEKNTDEPENAFEKKFFAELEKFAFYNDLNEVCKKNNGKSISELIAEKSFKPVVENLLSDK